MDFAFNQFGCGLEQRVGFDDYFPAGDVACFLRREYLMSCGLGTWTVCSSNPLLGFRNVNMNEAIKLAIEKGEYKVGFTPHWRHKDFELEQEAYIALDPLFWQALGKALGWEKLGHGVFLAYSNPGEWEDKHVIQYPYYHALRFFELKLTGGDEEEFWKELLK